MPVILKRRTDPPPVSDLAANYAAFADEQEQGTGQNVLAGCLPNGQDYDEDPPEDPPEDPAEKQARLVAQFRACTPGLLAEMYVLERNARDDAKDVVAAHQKRLDFIASIIFEKMDQLKLTEFRPDSDQRTSVTDSEIRTAVVTDKEVFREFVKTQLLTGTDLDALDYLECRASLTTADEYMASNNNQLPPGMKINRVRKLRVNVTRGSSKK